MIDDRQAQAAAKRVAREAEWGWDGFCDFHVVSEGEPKSMKAALRWYADQYADGFGDLLICKQIEKRRACIIGWQPTKDLRCFDLFVYLVRFSRGRKLPTFDMDVKAKLTRHALQRMQQRGTDFATDCHALGWELLALRNETRTTAIRCPNGTAIATKDSVADPWTVTTWLDHDMCVDGLPIADATVGNS